MSTVSRQLVVATACRVLDCTDGTLPMPMTVLVEQYSREVSTCASPQYAFAVEHFVLHESRDRKGRLPL